MDWIVCGNFASLSCSTWISLWNGAIGALVAAVIGALVALMVVGLTNRHHSKQSEKSLQMSAIADLVAAAEACLQDTEPDSQGLARADNMLKMRSAVVRLDMSGDDASKLVQVLEYWPYRLHQLEVRLGAVKKRETEQQKDAWRVLRSSIARLVNAAPAWPRASPKERAVLVRTLNAKREEIEAYFVEYPLKREAKVEPETDTQLGSLAE